MINFLLYIFNPNNFSPHGEHFIKTPPLFWIFVIANLLIFISYVLIPVAMIYLVKKEIEALKKPSI